MGADRDTSFLKKAARWRRRVTGSAPPMVDDGSKAIARGDAARAMRQWRTAADAYAEALALRPHDAAVRVQLGHMLKEDDDLLGAAEAYRAATDSRLGAEANLHLGHVLKRLGRRDDAVAAFAAALEADPGLMAARNVLIEMDAREALPASQMDRATLEFALRRAARLQADADDAKTFADSLTTFPVSAWDRFRRVFPVAPPPAAVASSVSVLIDARGLDPWAVQATLSQLEHQTTLPPSVVVLGDPSLRDHPLASLSFRNRPVFAGTPTAAAKALGPEQLLMLSAGAAPDPSALAWFSWAAGRTGADIVYADHDRYREEWRTGRVHFAPSLQSAPDPVGLAETIHPPAAVWLRIKPEDLAVRLEGATGADFRRALLLEAALRGSALHLPRVLISVADEAVEPVLAAPSRPVDARDERIGVIIPSRDQPDLLQAAVESLKRLARDPGRIEILVIDNRGSPANRERLASLEAAGLVSVVPADQPFNWSVLNNLGARSAGTDLLVFCNDDVEMLTTGWDDRLAARLSTPEPTVLGARLLYPDQTVQHAGVVFGRDPNGPVHEGVGAAATEGGPLDRWRRPRSVGAVTGAFLACRRSTFDSLGGFDEGLAIAFNDLDFCLRARETGGRVIYAAEIELVHHESKSRGLNDTFARVRWDREELATLHARWGQALFDDPGVNPHWSSAHNRVFDGYRDPSYREIVRYVDGPGGRNPWKVERSV